MPGDARPIGIFDSGVGGLTVYRALRARLPQESFIYLGDTARIPYGTRSPETIRRYAREDAAFLLACGVKLIVVACNTASSLALAQLQAEAPVPVIGMIEPGAQQAAATTRTRRVGVIGTEATVASAAYPLAIHRIAPEIEVVAQCCPLFVPLVEEGWAAHPVTATVAAEYLAPLRQSGVDTLVLGCTHYPLLAEVIQPVMGDAVTLVDSGSCAAQEVATVLSRRGCLAPPTATPWTRFCVTDAGDRFRRVAELCLQETLPTLESVRVET
ncbi:glutamate racemase [Chloracidobacterium validum]|uniref:Glutamate racemase n=1 Tax=Chloracidobacterium validum TaxID=2821543 RepID=A0ABX8B815_9BACT|nr:glutamate racemase [Chloracidobacterium validum]QUW03083.1 glutamate racemase [Chloracidobacterium validum]